MLFHSILWQHRSKRWPCEPPRWLWPELSFLHKDVFEKLTVVGSHKMTMALPLDDDIIDARTDKVYNAGLSLNYAFYEWFSISGLSNLPGNEPVELMIPIYPKL